MDMLFPTCENVNTLTGAGINCAINVAFNRQIGLCQDEHSFESLIHPQRPEDKANCRNPSQLCTPDNNFKFNLSNNDVGLV